MPLLRYSIPLKTTLLCCFVLNVFLANTLYSQDLSSVDVARTMNIEALQHPYLFFDNGDKQQIKDRIMNDPESKAIFAELSGEGKKLMYQPVDPAVPPRGTHDRAGWTELDREAPYRAKQNGYMRNALVLAFLYQMTGDEAYAQKAFEFAEVVSSFPTWTMQAHEFPIIYSRVMPYNVPDDQVNFNFDLGNAGTGMNMSLVYDWAYPAWNTAQRDRVRGALLEKVITPVRGDFEFHWWATAYRVNWVGVCSSGLGLSALALIKDHPQLTDVVAETSNRINKMFDELGVDGGWQEGGSYWRYGVERSVLMGYALKRLSGGKINMFNHEKMQTNPVAFPIYLFIPPRGSVDFGDSSPNAIGGTDFINLLTRETNSAEGAWYRENILGEGDDLFDLIFPKPTVKPSPPATTSRHFRTIDWWVMRSDFLDTDKVIVAGKAGKHDDPHHGHLDVGHFTVYWKGVAFLNDSGRPYYDEEYFDEERWTYPQASSAGHNTVIVNGELQIPGKLRGKPFNFDIGGKVLAFKAGDERDYVLMDGANAYPKKELKKWRRHVTLEKPHITFVLDEVESARPGAEVELRFHTGATQEIHDNFTLLRNGENAMALVSLSTDGHQFHEGKHAYQPIHATRKFEWLPYFGVVTTPAGASTIIATVIAPVADEAEARALASSLKWDNEGQNVTVTLFYRGEQFDFRYKRDTNGLEVE